MIWSSTEPTARLARDVDQLMAAEWAPEELHALALADARGAGPGAALSVEARIAAAVAEAEARAAAEGRRCAAREHARGFEEGRRAGEEAEGARLRGALQIAEEALDQVREGEMRWTGAIEENVCALAVAVARQIVGRELEGDMEAVVDLVRKALAEFPIDQPVRIRVNPQQLAAIEAHGAEPGTLMGAAAQGRQLRWIADARLAPGGCVVEGRERLVDGRVDSALERIYRRLTYTNA